MTILIAAVVLVGLLCVFDLLLTFAVLRRLREHSAELGRLTMQQPTYRMYDPQVLVGTTAPELPGASGARLVAFFDANCDSCHDHAPEFAGMARSYENALAIVSGKGLAAEELVTVVGPDTPLVRGEEAQALIDAVGLKAFPTFLFIEADGTIAQAVTEPGALARPVPAA
ncbi:hypothetical protein ACFUTV_10020 [Streptomyces sp. NPDC057298]|uniref:hypothetical protein n=1 Tax=Streptomyces sp. NPDC057298 TaxID=3346091 RepID=UPI00362DCC61